MSAPGKRGIVRPQYRQMLDDLADGDAHGSSRPRPPLCQPLELEEFVRVCDGAGVTELAGVTGDINLASGDESLTAADRILAGESVKGICRDLNERGIKTSTGRIGCRDPDQDVEVGPNRRPPRTPR